MRAVSIGMVIVSLDAVLDEVANGRVSCFTPGERDYAMDFRDPLLSLAARLCAKRAFQLWGSAAHGPVLRLDEVEVLGTPFGPPRLVLRGDTLRVAAGRGVRAIHLSLSHCQGYAGALLAVTTDPDGEPRTMLESLGGGLRPPSEPPPSIVRAKARCGAWS